MASKMLSGSPILMNDNNIPGVGIHKEIKKLLPDIEAACRKMGLDYFPIVLEFMTYDEVAEIAAYGGFPVRYPHWKWGLEYEQLLRNFEYGQGRISEMVINNDPCYIYIMNSNSVVDNVDVIAHAIGHNDFFKNNIFFEKTNRKMIDKMANHGARFRKYMSRWGRETVIDFVDNCLRVQTLIDPASAWKKKKVRKERVKDERNYRFPNRIPSKNDYMDDWVNGDKYIEDQYKKIEKEDAADYLDIFEKPVKDVFGFLRDNAPLKPWQQDIISMLHEEAMYFAPQRLTKMINEGWASFVDYNLMSREGLASLGQDHPSAGIFHYAKHKMLVLGGKWSENPYKLGYELLMDIERRWNKGQFGREWDDCDNMQKYEGWDTKANKGMDKLFDVRKHYNDFTLIAEFFTPELCEKMEYYHKRRYPKGEIKIVDRDFNIIKKQLMDRYLNGGLPDIRLMDPNHAGKGWLFLQHYWTGSPLYDPYARETLASLYAIWNNICIVATRDMDGEEYCYVCDGPNADKQVFIMKRSEYEKEYMS